MKNIKVYRPEWKKWSDFWKGIRPPWRPTKLEKRFIKRQISLRGEVNSRALVHGATPEYRELLADSGFEVWLLDINREMIEGMGLIMKNRNQKEKRVIGNWLDKPFKKNYFDFVLADETLDNISFKSYGRYLKSVKEFLKPDGYFIYGAYCIPERIRQVNFDELARLYNKNPKFFKKWENKCYLWHWVQKKSKILNHRKWEHDFAYFDKEIKRLYSRGKISRQGLKDLQYNLGTYKTVNMYRRNLEVWLKKYFKIIESWTVPKMKYRNKIVYILKNK